MRDKWDSRRGGTTYGAQTIERAIEGCAEFYRPRERRADRPSRPVRPSRVNDKNMMRQRNSRLCRKYGLKGRRERKK